MSASFMRLHHLLKQQIVYISVQTFAILRLIYKGKIDIIQSSFTSVLLVSLSPNLAVCLRNSFQCLQVILRQETETKDAFCSQAADYISGDAFNHGAEQARIRVAQSIRAVSSAPP